MLKPGLKLIMLLLTDLSTGWVVVDSWYLAHCTVVGLLLGDLKPLRLLMNGRCTENGRVTSIRALQTVELLRGRSWFTILLIICVYPIRL